MRVRPLSRVGPHARADAAGAAARRAQPGGDHHELGWLPLPPPLYHRVQTAGPRDGARSPCARRSTRWATVRKTSRCSPPSSSVNGEMTSSSWVHLLCDPIEHRGAAEVISGPSSLRTNSEGRRGRARFGRAGRRTCRRSGSSPPAPSRRLGSELVPDTERPDRPAGRSGSTPTRARRARDAQTPRAFPPPRGNTTDARQPSAIMLRPTTERPGLRSTGCRRGSSMYRRTQHSDQDRPPARGRGARSPRADR